MTTFLHFTTFKTILSKPIIFFNIHKRFGGGKKPPLSPKKVEDAINAVKGLPPPPSHPILPSPTKPPAKPTTPAAPIPPTPKYQGESHPVSSLLKKDHNNTPAVAPQQTSVITQVWLNEEWKPRDRFTSLTPFTGPFLSQPKFSLLQSPEPTPLLLLPPPPPPLPPTPPPPTPPPLPKTPLTKPSHTSKESVAFTDQIKMLNKTKGDGENIKPSDVPNNMKLKIKPDELSINKIKSQSGKEFKTMITKDTKSTDITEDQLKQELINRELAKPDTGQTAANITLQDNSEYLLGETKNKIKLTELGQAYFSQTDNNDLNTTITYVPLSSKQTNINDFRIIVPPKSNDNIFIEDGKQKHLLVSYCTSTDQYFAVGYFTSKNTGKHLSNQQFKDFQKQQENDNLNTGTKNKEQYCVFFKNPIEIQKKDIAIVKGSDDYLKKLSQDGRDLILSSWNDIKEKRITFFNQIGYTKEHIIAACLLHDETAKNKKKHPLTENQIKQNQENQKKQKEKFAQNIKKNEESNNYFY